MRAHDLETRPGERAQRLAVQQQAGRWPRAAPDPAAQLVQLGEPEALRLLDHDHGRVGHVDPDLDHRGGHQQLERAGREVGHDPVLVPARHPAVDQPDDLAKARLERPVTLLRGRLVGILGGFGIADQRADPIEALAALERGPDPCEDRLEPGKRQGAGPDAAPSGRLLAQLRDRHVAIERQHEGARDRGRGHHQEVRALALGGQAQALMDAEAVLLVDHRERQIGERHALLEQGVGPDHDPAAACGQIGEQPDALGTPLTAGEQGRLQPGRRQQARERRLVLARQDLGRRHDRRLAARLDRAQHGEQCHQRLAAADVALEQPQHADRLRHVGADLRQHPLLPRGQAEGQGAQHRPAEPAVAGERPPGLAGGALADQGERQLAGEQLVEGEALARRPIQRHLVGARRLVQAPECFPEARPAPPLEQGPILPFRQLGEVLERLPGEPVHDPGAEAPGQRIDRLQRTLRPRTRRGSGSAPDGRSASRARSG